MGLVASACLLAGVRRRGPGSLTAGQPSDNLSEPRKPVCLGVPPSGAYVAGSVLTLMGTRYGDTCAQCTVGSGEPPHTGGCVGKGVVYVPVVPRTAPKWVAYTSHQCCVKCLYTTTQHIVHLLRGLSRLLSLIVAGGGLQAVHSHGARQCGRCPCLQWRKRLAPGTAGTVVFASLAWVRYFGAAKFQNYCFQGSVFPDKRFLLAGQLAGHRKRVPLPELLLRECYSGGWAGGA